MHLSGCPYALPCDIGGIALGAYIIVLAILIGLVIGRWITR